MCPLSYLVSHRLALPEISPPKDDDDYVVGCLVTSYFPGHHPHQSHRELPTGLHCKWTTRTTSGEHHPPRPTHTLDMTIYLLSQDHLASSNAKDYFSWGSLPVDIFMYWIFSFLGSLWRGMLQLSLELAHCFMEGMFQTHTEESLALESHWPMIHGCTARLYRRPDSGQSHVINQPSVWDALHALTDSRLARPCPM